MVTATNSTYNVSANSVIYAGLPEPSDAPSWILSKPLNQWFTAPSSVVGSITTTAIMDTYSGTVLAGNKLYAFGGGHGSSANNTVAVYDLVAATGWTVANAATPVQDQVFADNSNFGEDRSWWGAMGARKPNPPHTYSSGVYMPEMGRIVWTGQRGIYNVGGNPNPHFWLQLTLPDHQWIQPESAETIKDKVFGRCSMRIPDGKVYGSNSGTAIQQWDYSQPSGSQFIEWVNNPQLNWSGYGQYVHDSIGNRIIRIGNAYSGAESFLICSIDMTTKVVTNLRPLLTGNTSVLSALDADLILDTVGACFDPINNRIVMPNGASGGAFYSINMSTFAVDLITPTTVSGHTVGAKPSGSAGIYGRIHYHSGWKSIIYNPSGSASTCILRLA